MGARLGRYGTALENEIEVFGFMARANDDPRAFSLLAMVISLFKTGYFASAAGPFEADAGDLSTKGMATRPAGAMRRGALTCGSHEFMDLDWFTLADRPVAVVGHEIALVAKDPAVLTLGWPGPWQPAGISKFALQRARAAAVAQDRPHILAARPIPHLEPVPRMGSRAGKYLPGGRVGWPVDGPSDGGRRGDAALAPEPRVAMPVTGQPEHRVRLFARA
jgi:hypothetical protein